MEKARKTITARKYLTFLTSIFLFPLIIFLLVYDAISLQSFQSVNKELVQTGQRTIEMYQLLLEQELTNQCISVANNWTSNLEHRTMLSPAGQVDLYYAVNTIKERYRAMMSSSFCLRGMSLHSSANQVQSTWVQEGTYSYELALKIHEVMCNIAQHANEHLPRRFFPQEVDGHHFLFRIVGYDSAYTVLMVDMDAAAVFQNQDIPQDNGFLCYATDQGEVFCNNAGISEDHPSILLSGEDDYVMSNSRPNYLVTGRTSDLLGLQLLYFIPYSSSITAMKTLHLILPLLSLGLLTLMPLLYHLLKRSFFMPIDQLSTAISHIRQGNLDERTDENFLIQEFSEVGITFNRMISEIQNLKIVSYEKELQKNDAQMQYLQLQLRPHFFLNCLKILYSMAEQKKYDRFQEMILRLSTYLRGKFQDNSTCIPLKDELDFVQNYIDLQRESMLQDVRYTEELEDSVEFCTVPALLLQTFIENSFKYARRKGAVLELSVFAVRLPSDEGDFLDIILRDNGNGFDLQTMERINRSADDLRSHEHLGIANVKQRLAILYGERAVLQISNLDCGAQIEIILPA